MKGTACRSARFWTGTTVLTLVCEPSHFLSLQSHSSCAKTLSKLLDSSFHPGNGRSLHSRSGDKSGQELLATSTPALRRPAGLRELSEAGELSHSDATMARFAILDLPHGFPRDGTPAPTPDQTSDSLPPCDLPAF